MFYNYMYIIENHGINAYDNLHIQKCFRFMVWLYLFIFHFVFDLTIFCIIVFIGR